MYRGLVRTDLAWPTILNKKSPPPPPPEGHRGKLLYRPRLSIHYSHHFVPAESESRIQFFSLMWIRIRIQLFTAKPLKLTVVNATCGGGGLEESNALGPFVENASTGRRAGFIPETGLGRRAGYQLTYATVWRWEDVAHGNSIKFALYFSTPKRKIMWRWVKSED